ncbi:MAG TPA: HNH endonuclease [Sandaracinaceae bacterium LLY-WYZ-13_1]|nr:HNH endonuclease [Sandaracinaceae bacterium LLY-WYZ-13_1]
METLVLTNGYFPHRIVTWQKAVTMSYVGKVEVVETYEEIVRSVSLAMEMPAVVRLTRPVRHRPPRVRFSRVNVLTRDGFRCQYCGETLPARELTYDHVVPRSKGGRTSWTNIVTACRPCNHRKGNRTPTEAGMTLRQPPVRPKSLPFPTGQLRLGQPVPDPWKTWVWWTADA